MRVKQDYILQDKGNGKLVPEKVGLKSIQRDGVDYEFTVVLDIDMNHNAKCSKDRTGLFVDGDVFKITAETGKKIAEWCTTGVSVSTVKKLIDDATDVQELTEIYKTYTAYYTLLEADFLAKKSQLTTSLLTHPKIVQNGINTPPAFGAR